MSYNQDCQYKILERVYFVQYDELIKKIKNGSVLRHDQVKLNNSDWNEAEKFPALAAVFEEKEKQFATIISGDYQNIYTNFQVPDLDFKEFPIAERKLEKACSIHEDTKPFYICIVCDSLFCRDCPQQDGKNALICPFCGGKCDLYMGRVWKLENKKPAPVYDYEEIKDIEEEEVKYEDVYSKLTLRDFINALLYPLRYPIGLLVGGLLFSTLVLGQIVTLFRGGAMLWGTLAITGVILTLKFGVMFKCFENRTQTGKKRRGFMPHIMKFGFFEDFIVPLFSGFQLFIFSFGLFIILALTAGTYAWWSFSGDLEKIQTEAVQTERRLNAIVDTDQPDTLLNLRREREAQAIIDNLRTKRLETVFGTNHLAENKNLERLILSILGLTIWLQMPICFAFILGILVFPAMAMAVEENHFQPLRKKFLSGFKMMKIIGFDYVKILFMCLMLLFFSVLNIYVLNALFSKLEMPSAAVLSAIVVGGVFIFYFWVTLSSILSTTLVNKEIIPQTTRQLS